MPPVIGVAGWKNSGKTTLVSRLIAEFSQRGFKVAAIKHAHHGFDVDQPGRDSFRFREAGAREVAIVSSSRWALMTELRDETAPQLDDILKRLSGSDLVIVEGFKTSPHPKIETRRLGAADHAPLSAEFPGIIAVASDAPCEAGGLPFLDLNDPAAIADFIAGRLRLPLQSKVNEN